MYGDLDDTEREWLRSQLQQHEIGILARAAFDPFVETIEKRYGISFWDVRAKVLQTGEVVVARRPWTMLTSLSVLCGCSVYSRDLTEEVTEDGEHVSVTIRSEEQHGKEPDSFQEFS